MKFRALVILLLCCGCQAGIAQSFSLFYHDLKLPEDTVLLRTGTPDTLEMTTWLTIRNDAATEKQVQAKKTEISMAPGAASSICWAGYCYPTETFESSYPLVLGPGATEYSCFAHFITGGTIGTSIVRWTYFDSINPTDSVSVVIQYITYPTGISGFGLKDRIQAFPNPADREVVFRLQELVPYVCTLTIRTLAGKTVLQEKVTGADRSLKLDTSVLPAGIYLYSLTLEGKAVGSGKVVICH